LTHYVVPCKNKQSLKVYVKEPSEEEN